MSTGYLKTFGEIEEESGSEVVYHWDERFDYILSAVEVNGEMHWNPDFDDEYFDAKFGGSDYYGAERMWRE